MAKFWTEEDINTLIQLRGEGCSWPEISRTMGRTAESCRLKFTRGLPLLAKSTSYSTFRGEGPEVCVKQPEGGFSASVESGPVSEKGRPKTEHDFELPRHEFGRLPIEVFDGGDWQRFGLVSDTHLCCKEERLDALHAQYDLFVQEGITTVFHAGNIVDGYIARINGDSVYETTIDGQAQYVVDNYPQRPGITTHYITGDDHESWFAPGFNFGAYLDMLSKKQGRTDLNYLGHVEADVELRLGKFSQVMKIQHPGGGSAYARSYKGQKMVESFSGGEKPAILVQGHYHVSGYTFDRNVHVIGMPGFQDQTIFGRKKHLRFEVGGCIIEFKMSPTTGAITRFRPEFNMFFDRGFYKPYLKSDRRLVQGHFVVNV